MALIRFRCARCQHPLKVESEAAGKKLLCPVCYLELTVPEASTIKPVDASQLYAADAEPLDVREMGHRREFASLRCDVCHTNIAVRKEQIGREVVCPDCGTKMIVPPEIAQTIDAATNDKLDAIMLGFDTASAKNTYGVRDGDSAPLEDYSSRFPVYCKLCNTIMYATEDQIGQELTCPDCDTKTVVPAKPQKVPTAPIAPSSFEGHSTFDIKKSEPPSKEPLVPVVCELCGTRMYAKESELGRFKTCPDCGRRTEVKPVAKEELVQPEISSGDAYGLSTADAPPARPAFRTMADYRNVDGSLDKELYGIRPPEERNVRNNPFSPASPTYHDSAPEADAETLRVRRAKQKAKTDREIATVIHRRRPLPKHPLTDGLLSPILTWRVMIRLLMSTTLGCTAILVGNLFPGLFVIVSLAFGAIVLMLWGALQTNFCWSVFHFSTDGNDDFDEWIEFSLFGSLGLWVWLVCYSILGAAPGYMFSSCFPGQEFVEYVREDGRTIWIDNPHVIIRDYIFMRLSHWIFFPLFFLSSMEAGSYFSPFAKRTFQTFARYTGVWFRFYGLAFLFILLPELAFLGLSYFAARIFDGVFLAVSFFLLGFFGLNFFSLLYFRLLGRLAWVLEENIRRDDEEEDE